MRLRLHPVQHYRIQVHDSEVLYHLYRVGIVLEGQQTVTWVSWLFGLDYNEPLSQCASFQLLLVETLTPVTHYISAAAPIIGLSTNVDILRSQERLTKQQRKKNEEQQRKSNKDRSSTQTSGWCPER